MEIKSDWTYFELEGRDIESMVEQHKNPSDEIVNVFKSDEVDDAFASFELRLYKHYGKRIQKMVLK